MMSQKKKQYSVRKTNGKERSLQECCKKKKKTEVRVKQAGKFNSE